MDNHYTPTGFTYPGNYQCTMSAPPPMITVEMYPVDAVGGETDSIDDASVSINNTDYMDWLEPFKNEFKEFLLERYPDKIVQDQAGFNRLFGDK